MDSLYLFPFFMQYTNILSLIQKMRERIDQELIDICKNGSVTETIVS